FRFSHLRALPPVPTRRSSDLFKADRLILVAERALETSKLKREVSNLRKRGGHNLDLIGTSLACNQLRQTIERVAPTNSRIMITRSEEHTSELQSHEKLVCRLL